MLKSVSYDKVLLMHVDITGTDISTLVVLGPELMMLLIVPNIEWYSLVVHEYDYEDSTYGTNL
jgi:hypothetical protein